MSRQQPITLSQAEEAVFIDFEGNVDHAPSILGIRCGDTTRQYVIEAELASFGELRIAKYNVTVATLEQALRQLQEASTGRVIAGFTTHELGIVATYCTDPGLREWFSAAYVNVKKPIDRWIRHQTDAGVMTALDDRSLLAYMKATGLSYKPGCGQGTVGPGLTKLRAQLARHGTATATTPRTRERWWRILSHNATDLEATQTLTLRALGGDH